ncbi:cyclic diguanylate phosphodiesterase [Actinoplanes sp. NBRC 14428]|uniref:EAL and modified HD-GYP domain-containing signal transduction protein n=1 Tax=Pseudosporangium ferrugineum TaxID=439699 RepID=A0A2T0RDU1_9ACTN|nr:EAL and modified HD-GYP domain-containing signal transduction protein [Pseudosporangium ferrugineum]BCJ54245.1 cyclic diguanylate phosphodiesterase [Actinoplanes sp. NBRC 14428]
MHIGRQPIFDASGDIAGYELLFRGNTQAVEADRRDAYATSQVIVNAFTEFGLDEVVGDRMCFINMTREFLTGELILPFGPENVVLEILETIDVDDAVVAGVTNLVAAGYRIALDDFVWQSGHERLLPLASYVKLDLPHCDLDRLADQLAFFRGFPHVEIVAEGLETLDDLALCDRHGIELRQGYVLSRPQVMTAACIPPFKLRRLELLGALSEVDADLDRVVEIISSDPALTMRVLRASNSAAVGSIQRVSSIRQAVVLLGLGHIRRWAMLMVVDDVAEATEAQLTNALTRARLCHNLAARFDADPDAAFVAGLITAVAELLGITASSMVNHLPLTADLVAALTRGIGPLGRMLRVVDAYEHGDMARMGFARGGNDLTGAVMDALRWSTQTVAAASRQQELVVS